MTQHGPARIGPYTIERVLGEGGNGRAYLARHERLGRLAVVKVPSRPLDEALRGRFAREAEAAARVHHEGVAQVFDARDDDVAGPFIAQEYVAGESLDALLQRVGKLEPVAATRLGAQLAAALAAIHAAGVLHRDLKPSNVMLCPDGAPKIVDFGLASFEGAKPLTLHGVVLGTPGYLAPEQVGVTPGSVGPPADVFGLGAILYCALVGHGPQQEHSQMGVPALLAKRINAPVGAPDLGPGQARLAELVGRLLAYEPDARPTAEEARRALVALLPGAQRPDRAWVVLSAAALGGVTLGVAVLAASRGGTPPPIAPRPIAPASEAAAVAAASTRPTATPPSPTTPPPPPGPATPSPPPPPGPAPPSPPAPPTSASHAGGDLDAALDALRTLDLTRAAAALAGSSSTDAEHVAARRPAELLGALHRDAPLQPVTWHEWEDAAPGAPRVRAVAAGFGPGLLPFARLRALLDSARPGQREFPRVDAWAAEFSATFTAMPRTYLRPERRFEIDQAMTFVNLYRALRARRMREAGLGLELLEAPTPLDTGFCRHLRDLAAELRGR